MKNVLLLVHDDEGQEARLQTALDLTRAVNGHLTCLAVELVSAVFAFTDGSVISAEMVAAEQDRATANYTRLAARLAREDVAWDWKEAAGLPPKSIEAEAGFADIIVLSSQLDRYDPLDLRRMAGHVAEKAGRPILAVPKQSRGLDFTGPVLVAWDGSRGADDALRDAAPLLKLSRNVTLIDLDEPDGVFAPGTAASWLSRHDIHAEVEVARRKAGGTVFSDILDRAHAADAAYIVMGAYGHSPAFETIFGGVTRSMLASSDLPLFLSH